jgi:hypothetical protein
MHDRRIVPPGQPLWVLGLVFVAICVAFLGFRLLG